MGGGYGSRLGTQQTNNQRMAPCCSVRPGWRCSWLMQPCSHAAVLLCLLLVPSSDFCLLSPQPSTDPLSTALIGAHCTFLMPLPLLIMAVPQRPDGVCRTRTLTLSQKSLCHQASALRASLAHCTRGPTPTTQRRLDPSQGFIYHR